MASAKLPQQARAASPARPPRRRASALVVAAALALAFSACSHKIEIQQGNNSLRENIAKLKTGMTQEEVESLLGPAQVDRLFRDNLWLYAYQMRESGFFDSPKWVSVELEFDGERRLVKFRQLRDDYQNE